jgi:hypothetical protein
MNDAPNASTAAVSIRSFPVWNWRAVTLGTLFQIGMSRVLMLWIGMMAVMPLLDEAPPPQRLAEHLRTSTDVHIFTVAGGLLCAACGGYLAAVRCGVHGLSHAALAGVAAMFGNAVLFGLLGNPHPLWLCLVLLGAIIPASVAGGYLAMPAASIKADHHDPAIHT